MRDLFSALGTAAAATAVVFLLIIFETLMGLLTGWAVGVFFSETILGILEQLGVQGVYMWEVGAFLGFVGGFFRTRVKVEDKAKKAKVC